MWFFTFIIYFIFYTFSNLFSKNILEYTTYPQFCLEATRDEKLFEQFKRHPDFQLIFGCSYETGLEALNLIRINYSELLPFLEVCKENDVIGSPILQNYENYGCFAPLTLRDIKIVGELKRKFGDLSHLHLIDLGGYGGLCHLIHKLGGFASYTIVNLKESNMLAQKYIQALNIPNVSFVNISDLLSHPDMLKHHKYDLALSQYFFAGMDKVEQNLLYKILLKEIPRGYFILNFISSLFNVDSLQVDDLLYLFYHSGKKGEIEEERPLTHKDNIILSWKDNSYSAVNAFPKKYSSSVNLQAPNAITYSFSGGRLGDNLLSYLHAKWLSYKYGLPLLYQPFPFSNCFQFHFQEQLLKTENLPYKNHSVLLFERQIDLKSSSNLWVAPYFPDSYSEYLFILDSFPYLKDKLIYFKVDWMDPYFKKEMQAALKLIESPSTLDLPKDKVKVAVHVRKGGGVDLGINLYFPYKMPPDIYYIQQIQRVYNLFRQPLYVYIFTDDLNPNAIKNLYQTALNNSDIIFDCRKTGNGPYNNVLEDFYNMMQFDCLIRPESNFSLIAGKLADYCLEISPCLYEMRNGQPFITQTHITFKPKS